MTLVLVLSKFFCVMVFCISLRVHITKIWGRAGELQLLSCGTPEEHHPAPPSRSIFSPTVGSGVSDWLQVSAPSGSTSAAERVSPKGTSFPSYVHSVTMWGRDIKPWSIWPNKGHSDSQSVTHSSQWIDQDFVGLTSHLDFFCCSNLLPPPSFIGVGFLINILHSKPYFSICF